MDKVSTLSTELVEQILQVGDREALLSWALMNRRLLTLSRYSLFSSLEITLCSEPKPKHHEKCSRQCIGLLPSLLRSKFCTLPRQLHSLCITGDHSKMVQTICFWSLTSHSGGLDQERKILSPIFSYFTRVTELKLRKLETSDLACWPFGAKAELTRLLRNVRRLDIDDVGFYGGPSRVHWLLNRCPELESVHLGNIRWPRMRGFLNNTSPVVIFMLNAYDFAPWLYFLPMLYYQRVHVPLRLKLPNPFEPSRFSMKDRKPIKACSVDFTLTPFPSDNIPVTEIISQAETLTLKGWLSSFQEISHLTDYIQTTSLRHLSLQVRSVTNFDFTPAGLCTSFISKDTFIALETLEIRFQWNFRIYDQVRSFDLQPVYTFLRGFMHGLSECSTSIRILITFYESPVYNDNFVRKHERSLDQALQSGQLRVFSKVEGWKSPKVETDISTLVFGGR